MAKINKDRVEELRKEMEKEGIDMYIVPTDDYHISEYVGDFFKCREFLSGFTGSAGTLIVSRSDAWLWTDGRYFLQAKDELKDSGINLMKMGEPNVPDIEDFLKINALNMTIGYDGKTMSFSNGKKYRDSLKDNNVTFITEFDLVDRIWNDRPKMSKEKIFVLPVEYAGMTYETKLSNLRDDLKKEGCENMIVTALDEAAWFFNIRGNDVLYTPVVLSYALIKKDDVTIYIDKSKLSEKEIEYFKLKNVNVKEYFDIYLDVSKLEGKTLIDPNSTNELLVTNTKDYVLTMSPLKKRKAIKNTKEIENSKIAHLKDSIALIKTIYWIKKQAKSGEIYKETELSVEKHLTDLRKEQSNFISLSFDSIIASGSHGAIIHYEPTNETNKNIEKGFLLMDTGAQYLEGTTDVTRTVSVGEVDRVMKLRYTAVLKGHIDLAMAKFPKGTLGNSLDVLARKPIWDLGLDFNHGTGHGVGSLLGVHEGPNSIRRQTEKASLSVPMEPGMITSDEPGVYLEGLYGIRIENLFLTKEVENFDNFLTFEMLTLCPYDKDSINWFDLSDEELKYIRNYYDMILNLVSSYLSVDENKWLKEETTF